jgi:hypothetical protein
MLWALLAIYLFSSSGASELNAAFERVKTYIKSDIQNDTRQKELLAIVRDAEKTTKDAVKTRGRIVQDFLDVAERHDATEGNIRRVLDRDHAEVEAYQARMIKYRFDLKGKMTREEWAKVFSAEKTSLPEK